MQADYFTIFRAAKEALRRPFPGRHPSAFEKKRFSEEQIISFLRAADAGVTVQDLSHKHRFSATAYYRWRSKFGGARRQGRYGSASA